MTTAALVFLVTAVALPLLLNEFGDWAPWWAARLVRWTARSLPRQVDTDRYAEKWETSLHEVPGKLAKLAIAVVITAHSPWLRSSLRSEMAERIGAVERRRVYVMTYTRHPCSPLSVWTAGASSVVGIAVAAWTSAPSLGLFTAAGWAFLAPAMLWWQWSFTRAGQHRRFPLWAGTGMLVLLGGAGYEAAGLRGLETSGQLGHAALAVLLFVPALCVAATDQPQEPEPATVEK